MKRILLIAAAASMFSLAATAQTKFAHVNFGELVQLMPEADSAMVQLEAANNEAQETYNSMVSEFQSKYDQFEQKQATWTPAVRESKQKELMDIQTRVQEFQQAIQQDMNQLQNTLMAPIYQKAQEVVTNLAKEKGVIYVYDMSSLLYIDESQSINLTAEARERLNIPADKTIESVMAARQAQAGLFPTGKHPGRFLPGIGREAHAVKHLFDLGVHLIGIHGIDHRIAAGNFLRDLPIVRVPGQFFLQHFNFSANAFQLLLKSGCLNPFVQCNHASYLRLGFPRIHSLQSVRLVIDRLGCLAYDFLIFRRIGGEFVYPAQCRDCYLSFHLPLHQ